MSAEDDDDSGERSSKKNKKKEKAGRGGLPPLLDGAIFETILDRKRYKKRYEQVSGANVSAVG